MESASSSLSKSSRAAPFADLTFSGNLFILFPSMELQTGIDKSNWGKKIKKYPMHPNVATGHANCKLYHHISWTLLHRSTLAMSPASKTKQQYSARWLPISPGPSRKRPTAAPRRSAARPWCWNASPHASRPIRPAVKGQEWWRPIANAWPTSPGNSYGYTNNGRQSAQHQVNKHVRGHGWYWKNKWSTLYK